MINTILPLANWGVGTAIIIVFAVVCVVLSVMVINFVMKGKKKGEE
jgi:ABC-type spermidine/putrescine transport system permease subunit I|tara:strand:- start:201398 stop:201535 length:138 start_codon:yes stop_codon:yes gene_type:complete